MRWLYLCGRCPLKSHSTLPLTLLTGRRCCRHHGLTRRPKGKVDPALRWPLVAAARLAGFPAGKVTLASDVVGPSPPSGDRCCLLGEGRDRPARSNVRFDPRETSGRR